MSEDHEINPRDLAFEYMVPPSRGWNLDTQSELYYLEVDLPGFKEDEVRIRADSYGHVIVSGERQVDHNKIIHFGQAFKVPENADIEETSAILEDEIYYVTIPKKVASENKTSEVQNSTSFNNDKTRRKESVRHSTSANQGSLKTKGSGVRNSLSYNKGSLRSKSSGVQNSTSVNNGNNENPSQNNEDNKNKKSHDTKSSKILPLVLAAGAMFLLVLVTAPVVLRLRSHA